MAGSGRAGGSKLLTKHGTTCWMAGSGRAGGSKLLTKQLAHFGLLGERPKTVTPFPYNDHAFRCAWTVEGVVVATGTPEPTNNVWAPSM
jgi:hypothetical protein